jgi:hypothetical protein
LSKKYKYERFECLNKLYRSITMFLALASSGGSTRGTGWAPAPCADSLQVGGSKGEKERRGERESKGEIRRERKEEEGKGRERNKKVKRKR